MRAFALVSVLAALAAAAVAAPAPPTPVPMVRPEKLYALTPHVLVIPDESRQLVSNIGVIKGSRAVMVVDTGLGPANGRIVLQRVRDVAPGLPIHLVFTHAHPEHDLGASAFPADTVVWRSEDQAKEKDNDLFVASRFAAISPEIAELLKDAEFRPATRTFAKETVVDLGGVHVTLTAMGPAHTAGDTTIWVQEDSLLFSGDLAMKAQPAMVTPTATLADWRRVLAAEKALKPAAVVPSHGPVGDAGFIDGYSAYLDEVTQRTSAAKAAGQTLEAATETVWRAMQARYPDRGRLAGAVRTAYAS
jgi:glyoxylase-like metal-dependent hydrolase (beta-lactamase superfamily II)